ncbi:TAP42 family protein [Entamoeba marina]
MESIPAYLFDIGDKRYSDEEVFEHIRVIAKYKDILNNNKLISKNEELEDISTDILGYLMIDYIVAQLYGKLMMNRVQALGLSLHHYKIYLDSMTKYRIIPKDVVMNCITGKEMTGEEQRNERIEKYRMKKELKEGIEKFQKLREDERDDLDEEIERNYWISLFKLSVYESLDNYQMSKREQTMLTQIQQLKDDGIYEQTKQNEEIEAQKYRKQLQPFTITKGMTPENLSCYKIMMTDEDWEIEKGEEFLEKPAEDPHSSDEDSDRETDEKLEEKRYWDNFKDLHPKGSGNTLNMG